MKTKYEIELQVLKRNDEVQTTQKGNGMTKGYDLIITAGHGYLIVPSIDSNYKKAIECKSNYSFKGENAIYLEEDCDAIKFLKSI